MPAEGEPAEQHLMRKYGRTAADVAAGKQMQIERGQAIGFEFDLDKRTHIHNTFDAHRLLLWAAQEGRQIALKKILLRAYFRDGDNPNDHPTLIRLASEAGLDAARARKVLASGEFASEVRQFEEFYRQQGINSVPALILNGKHLATGSLSVEYYEQELKQIAIH